MRTERLPQRRVRPEEVTLHRGSRLRSAPGHYKISLDGRHTLPLTHDPLGWRLVDPLCVTQSNHLGAEASRQRLRVYDWLGASGLDDQCFRTRRDLLEAVRWALREWPLLLSEMRWPVHGDPADAEDLPAVSSVAGALSRAALATDAT